MSESIPLTIVPDDVPPDVEFIRQMYLLPGTEGKVIEAEYQYSPVDRLFLLNSANK